MIGLYKVANLHRMSFAKVRCPIEFHLLHVKKKKKNQWIVGKMLKLVGQYVQGLKGPFSQLISDRFLQEFKAYVGKKIPSRKME